MERAGKTFSDPYWCIWSTLYIAILRAPKYIFLCFYKIIFKISQKYIYKHSTTNKPTTYKQDIKSSCKNRNFSYKKLTRFS